MEYGLFTEFKEGDGDAGLLRYEADMLLSGRCSDKAYRVRLRAPVLGRFVIASRVLL